MGIKIGLKLSRNHKTSPCVDSSVNPNRSSFCTSWGPGVWKPFMFENRLCLKTTPFSFLFSSSTLTFQFSPSQCVGPRDFSPTLWGWPPGAGEHLKKTLQHGSRSSLIGLDLTEAKKKIKSLDLTEVIGTGLKIISTKVHRWVVCCQLVDPRNYCVVP